MEAHGRKYNTVFYRPNSRQLPHRILETCHSRVITKTIRLHGKAAKALERRRITSKTDGTSARAMDSLLDWQSKQPEGAGERRNMCRALMCFEIELEEKVIGSVLRRSLYRNCSCCSYFRPFLASFLSPVSGLPTGCERSTYYNPIWWSVGAWTW